MSSRPPAGGPLDRAGRGEDLGLVGELAELRAERARILEENRRLKER